jgi:hypothetical protein
MSNRLRARDGDGEVMGLQGLCDKETVDDSLGVFSCAKYTLGL